MSDTDSCQCCRHRRENIPNIHTANDDDGPRSIGDEHKSDRIKIFKSGTYRGVLSGDVLRDYPKQVVSSTQRQGTHRRTCANFSQVGKKRAPGKDRTRYLVRTKPKICGAVRKQRCASRLDPDSCSSRHTKEAYGADRRNFSASGPRESHITYSATPSASTNPDRRLADLVLNDTKITERQFDPAKERMLEQVLHFFGVYYKRSIIYPCSLHCVDGTTELDIAIDPTHERPEQSENKKCRVCRMLTSPQTTVIGRL